MTPDSFVDYVLLTCLALATVPLTLPLSAYALNRATSWITASRSKPLVEGPVDRARKRIDTQIVEGRLLRDAIPNDPTSSNSYTYQANRISHWVFRVDSELHTLAGYYAARWFAVDADPEYWRDHSWFPNLR